MEIKLTSEQIESLQRVSGYEGFETYDWNKLIPIWNDVYRKIMTDDSINEIDKTKFFIHFGDPFARAVHNNRVSDAFEIFVTAFLGQEPKEG